MLPWNSPGGAASSRRSRPGGRRCSACRSRTAFMPSRLTIWSDPGAEHRQGLGVAGLPADWAPELAERLPGPKPGCLGQVGGALVGPLGVGETVRGLPEPGPDHLEQRLDRRRGRPRWARTTRSWKPSGEFMPLIMETRSPRR